MNYRKNRLYGIGEPVTMDVLKGKTTPEIAVGIMKDLGVTAFREWMSEAMSPAEEDYDKICAVYDKTLDLCVQNDIEVTGVSEPTVPFDISHGDNLAIPERDLTPGSPYCRVLEATERNWERIVRRFPQIRQWEVGNEWNFPLFMHPVGWRAGEKAYTIEEMMLMACDLMYVSARGIRRADPGCTVVSFSPTPDSMGHYLPEGVPGCYGIAVCLDIMYRCIEEGRSFSKNTDDYFDMVAWHPYLSTQMGYAPCNTSYPAEKMYLTEDMPDALWKSYNDMAYHIMAKHGDGKKKVLLTEFGFSDCWNEQREKEQAALIPKCYELLKQMPYVKTCHFFRLFEEEDSNAVSNGIFTNESEAKFGIVREAHHNYAYRAKALELQKVYKGLN
ncbi:MAG: hypothetical protein Q4C91_05260 [Eubacteriales bacterium]|nr:hypothetical protein [Eubacteriales bacterium]